MNNTIYRMGVGKKLLVIAAFLCLFMAAGFAQEKPPFTKGINLIGWFEPQGETIPDLNKYDEADFACFKSMGVDVIRLPIHFEHVMEPKNTGKVNDIVLEKLDQICDWAEKYQIYLVIDNQSFNEMELQNNISPETYKSHLQALWPQIAQRYKDRSEYIIYEILNEPPYNLLSSWDKIQREIIDLIRKFDTKHTIVVTCANWSHGENLIKMKPYKDQNLIYAFHFYLPEQFAQQGGDGPFANIRGLPFPYDKKRMPELDDNLEDWVKDNIKNIYPQQGTVKFINNKIKEVAAWAKKNKVKIWCGEIGVASRMMSVDRLVCIKAGITALKDFNIPYCIYGIDDRWGFLKTEDKSLLFPDDIDESALEAYGLNMPEESLVAKTNASIKSFPQKPYVVYDGIAGKGTLSNMYGSVKCSVTNDSHKNCMTASLPGENANGSYFILPQTIWKKVVNNKEVYNISLSVKFSNKNQKFLIAIADTDEGEAALPWAIEYEIRASDYKSGEWVNIEIPLSKFYQAGAWSNKTQKYYPSEGKFDWTRPEKLEFHFGDVAMSGEIYIDDIVIKKK